MDFGGEGKRNGQAEGGKKWMWQKLRMRLASCVDWWRGSPLEVRREEWGSFKDLQVMR